MAKVENKKSKFTLDEWIGAIILSIMATIAFINVLSRYLFHFSLSFTEEIEINLFVWLTVLGIGMAFKKGSHLGMVTVFNALPKWLKVVVIIFTAITSFTLILIVNIYALKEIYQDLTLFHATSESLGIPVSIYTSGIPIFSLFVFYQIIKKTIIDVKQLLKK